MSVLIVIACVLFGIIALLLLLALFTKKTYSIEREIVIHRPNQQVFDYIKYLKNQDSFSYWATIDPNMKKTYKGTDGTPGFVAYWDSQVKQAGKGEQEILTIDEGRQVNSEIRFIRPFKGRSDAFMQTHAITDSETNVKWSIASEMKYPMNLMLLFLNMENMIGKDLSIGLTNLKSLMEK